MLLCRVDKQSYHDIFPVPAILSYECFHDFAIRKKNFFESDALQNEEKVHLALVPESNYNRPKKYRSEPEFYPDRLMRSPIASR